jgi:hypothetical protein
MHRRNKPKAQLDFDDTGLKSPERVCRVCNIAKLSIDFFPAQQLKCG